MAREKGNRNWKIEEDALLVKLFEDGLSKEELADQLNRSVNSISNRLITHELLFNFKKNPKQTVDTNDVFELLYKTVATFFYIEVSDIFIKDSSQMRSALIARQICHYLARKYTNHTLSTIGRIIGKLKPESVLHSIEVVKSLIETDKYRGKNIKIIDDVFAKNLKLMYKKQTIEEFLKERLLISDKGEIYTHLDELASIIKMYNGDIKIKHEINKNEESIQGSNLSS